MDFDEYEYLETTVENPELQQKEKTNGSDGTVKAEQRDHSWSSKHKATEKLDDVDPSFHDFVAIPLFAVFFPSVRYCLDRYVFEAPYETRHHMEYCIKALCIVDVTQDFKIGRDVSLPETYIRSARNPLRDLGGRPPNQRPILAFYAGSLHGYFRPTLLKHWKDKDPNMKIFGRMLPSVASKMSYIQHMKNSKYCICPKGYEVNSPRVVEAIFYECVPVIISDNFVPPFFEVLILELGCILGNPCREDIPRLKDILDSIPEEKYLSLQLGVGRVRNIFCGTQSPLNDVFHMTLHSIWYNRVFQINLRSRCPLQCLKRAQKGIWL